MTTKKTEILTIGLAIFSMFFGAGNLIYPLAVGSSSQSEAPFAMMGILITAVLMPICGLIAMILFEGDIRAFFGRIGRFPGWILALLTIFLLGPLGSTPRCLTLSYTSLKGALFEPSPYVFHAIACLVIYFLAVRRRRILDILGKLLTPALLLALALLVAIGLFTEGTPQSSHMHSLEAFGFGIVEGYKTMDLLAAFFFSATIIHLLKRKHSTEKSYGLAYRASSIGIFLLALVYFGFGVIAAKHGHALGKIAEEHILPNIANYLAGGLGGYLVRIIVSLACLTTAIVLITAFTEFVQKHLFRDKLGYRNTLIIALIATYLMTTLDYSGIAAFLWPLLKIFYPGLIVLTLLNILHKLYGMKMVRIPVYAAFVISLVHYFL